MPCSPSGATKPRCWRGVRASCPLLSFRLARPAHLVDVNTIAELAYISDGSGLEIGATVRQRDAERSEVVAAEAPIVAAALGFVGHAAIRNRGTVGGSIAHADPAAELPAVLTALRGEVVARSTRGVRTIPAESFIEGFLTTALEPDELVTAIRLPPWPASTGWAFNEFSRRNGDFAIVGRGHPGRARTRRSGQRRPDRLFRRRNHAGASRWRRAGHDRRGAVAGAVGGRRRQQAGAELDPPADLHGSPAYRRQLARVLAARSLQEAHERAKGAQ